MSPKVRPGEFELIARYLAPLAAGFPGAGGLKNDIAVLAPPVGTDLIVKTDAVVAGVHFLPDDPADLIARKALRVNLSDIAAGGGTPLAYQMALGLPGDWTEEWLARFVSGLAADQKTFGVHLCGGDTIAVPGPLTVSITAFGLVPSGKALGRGGARIGEDVWVTGTIGDAMLGLRVLRGQFGDLPDTQRGYLVDRYRLPQPRCSLGPLLPEMASASIDISDGLVADLAHICDVSGVGMELEFDAVPVSAAAGHAVGSDSNLYRSLFTAGDDYEIAFTAPVEHRDRVVEAGRRSGIPIVRIGRIVEGSAPVFLAGGAVVSFSGDGYRHF